MDKLFSFARQVNQQIEQIQQETPSIPQDIDKKEEEFNKVIAQCEQEFERVIKIQPFINLQIIQDSANYIVSAQRETIIKIFESDERSSQLYQLLIHNKVTSLIKEIKEKWSKSLTDILKNIDFFFDLEIWLNSIQENGFLNGVEVLQKLDQIAKKRTEKLQMSEQVQFQMVNQFIEAMRIKLNSFYTLQDFKKYKIEHEYISEYEDLNDSLNEIIVESFQKRYPQIQSFIKLMLDSYSESIKPGIQQKADEDMKTHKESIEDLLKCKIEYQKSFKHEYVTILQSGFDVNESISFLFYQDSLQALQFEIDKAYTSNIIKVKKEIVKNTNIQSEQTMKAIRDQILDIPFKRIGDSQEIINVINYIVYYFSITNQQQLSFLNQIVVYLSNYVQNDSQNSYLVKLNQATEGELSAYNNYKADSIGIIKEGAAKFIQSLMQCKL